MIPVPGYSGYSVSESGDLWCHRRNRYVAGSIISPPQSRTKYKNYSLRKDGKSFCLGAHRIVAMAYIGEIEKGMVVNHKDSNGLNNHVSNLEIVTAKVNSIHGSEMCMGIDCVLGIVSCAKCGFDLEDIAMHYNVSVQTVNRILSESYYGRVDFRYRQKFTSLLRQRLNKSESRQAAYMHIFERQTMRTISAHFVCSRSATNRAIKEFAKENLSEKHFIELENNCHYSLIRDTQLQLV
jgi:hypothetical protein